MPCPNSDYVAAFLGAISGPIELVGHSYGGAVINNAVLPDQGQTLLELATAEPGSCVA